MTAKRMIGTGMFILLLIVLLIPAIMEKGLTGVLEVIGSVVLAIAFIGWILVSICLMCGCGDD